MLTPEEESFLWDEVKPSFHELSGEIIILDRDDITDSRGRVTDKSFTDELDRISDEYEIDCVCLDYIQMVGNFKALSGEEGVNEFIAFFHSLIVSYKEKGLIGILVSQANRQGWAKAARNQGAYTLQALAEYNHLERNSYYVVSA